MKRPTWLITWLLCLLAASILLSACGNDDKRDVPVVTWQKTFGGPGDDRALSIQQTSGGEYIIAGYTANQKDSNGGSDVYLLKTDPEGNEQWGKTFGGSDDDLASSVQQTSDGGYIIGGSTKSYGAGGWDIYLIKTDKEGNEQWSKTFGGSDDDLASSVQQTSDGGYILTGYTGDQSQWDTYLVRTDAKGNKEWSKTFDIEDYDAGSSIQQAMDGGYIVAGYTIIQIEAGTDNKSDGSLLKVDSEGNEEWRKTFGGSDDDLALSVQQTTDGGYIIGGSTKSYGTGSSDVYLVKTDGEGNEQWSKTFGGLDDDYPLSVQQTTDGGYIIGGSTESYGAGGWDVYLVKTDKEGNEVWSRTFGGPEDDLGSSVQQTSDGGYIIAGGTESYGAGLKDVYLIKTDSEGNCEPMPSSTPQ